MTKLFEELKIKDIRLKNRIAVSPMCQYSSVDGIANDWHLVHLGSRATGGFGLIVCEATAISPEGRISPDDAGIWSDKHIEPLARINKFISENNTVPGIQLAHAGRKASTPKPWDKGYRSKTLSLSEGGWQIIAPSPLAFSDKYSVPKEMNDVDIQKVIKDFSDATKRSLDAGYKWLEIHAAHGYLINNFLSPLSNKRTDKYGGCFENRIRILIEIIDQVKKVWKESYPLTIRISATEWVDGGWDINDSVELSKTLKEHGVDLIDCSSGGNISYAKIPLKDGYQVEFSEKIKNKANILTGAVGLITEANQAEQILNNNQADLIFLAREALREPYWAIKSAQKLGYNFKDYVPIQYERAYI